MSQIIQSDRHFCLECDRWVSDNQVRRYSDDVSMHSSCLSPAYHFPFDLNFATGATELKPLTARCDAERGGTSALRAHLFDWLLANELAYRFVAAIAFTVVVLALASGWAALVK